MKKIVVIGLGAALALSGCAAPLVKLDVPAMQHKVAHANDWLMLAKRAVAAMPSSTVTQKPTVYIAPGPADMPFAVAYQQALEQALTEAGYRVVRSSPGAVVMNYQVQTFLYGGLKGNQKQLIDYASFYTTIGSLGSQLRHTSSFDTGAFEVLLAGPIIDVLAQINSSTRAEVTVSTRVIDDRSVHYAKSETFYVQPTDLPFYWTDLPSASPQVISADANGLPLVALPVRVAR